MATTTGGTTYVTSTDLVANYPSASLALANRVDVVASGSMSKKTASYTVTVADILAGTTICMNSASATVVTLPSSSLVNGMMLNVFSVNTGAVTFTGGTVTGTATSITAQYSGVSLTYDSAAAVWWCLPFAGGSAAATVASTTGSPATGTITYSGTTYSYYKFTASGTITFGNAGFASVVCVGGGGSGGVSGGFTGGAGGGGGVIDEKLYIGAGEVWTITVGALSTTGDRILGNFSRADRLIAIGGSGGASSGAAGSSAGATGSGGSNAAAGAAGYGGAQGYAGSGYSGGGAGGAASGSAPFYGAALTTWAGSFGQGGVTGSGTGTVNTGNAGGTGSSSGSGVVWIGLS